MKKMMIVMLMLLLLTACGGTENENRDNTFVVGMECDYAPFNWTQPYQGKGIAINEVDYADGYDVRIAQKIADDLGKELVIKKYDWNSLIVALNAGDIDAIIAGMTDTPERREAVNFTSPYYESQMVVIVRKDSDLTNITSIQQLNGKRVLGQMNTIYDVCIDQIDNVEHVTPMESYPLMTIALKEGAVDAITAEQPVANAIVSANDELTYVTFANGNGFVADTTVSVAIAKENTDLLNAVEAALSKISQDERNSIMEAAIADQPAAE